MENYNIKSYPSKVLLVIPPQDENLFRYSTPNLGIGYIGASLKKQNHSVRIFDSTFFEDHRPELLSVLNEFGPDIVGITGFSFQYKSILEIAKAIKKANPGIITVLGGPHASVLSGLIIKKDQEIDFVISGEGEESFPDLIETIYKNNGFNSVAGLVYRENLEVRSNSPKSITGLDDLCYPWDIINPLDYQRGQVHGFIAKRLPITQVVSSRGCPYQCSFCAARTIHGSKIRMRDPKKFVDELEFLANNYKIRELQVIDDNFTFYRDHAAEVCNEIIKRKLDITWSLPNGVRADKLDEGLLKLMKKAGCYYMSFGIEFGSKRILELCKKSLDLEKAKVSIKTANRLGFIMQGFFIMGYPTEKIEDILMTSELIGKLPLDKVLISMAFPYPGTELFDYYIEKRYHNVSDIDWDTFIESDFKRIFEYVSDELVKKVRKETYMRFYLNPVNLFRFLLKFRTWVQFKTAWQGFKVLLRTATGRA
ncbi:MAG: B12-binding domain-containing radical SAM protein [Elusimicrobia bacterium]|nr:B12-binding domain-containing radical SAM protein [Candidatus Liberimonas magnetica]